MQEIHAGRCHLASLLTIFLEVRDNRQDIIKLDLWFYFHLKSYMKCVHNKQYVQTTEQVMPAFCHEGSGDEPPEARATV
jgi:hypothetical protein